MRALVRSVLVSMVLVGVAVDAGAIEVIGTVDTPGTAKDVARSGDLYFVADGVSGLRVIDVSDPGSPVEIGFYDTTGLGNTSGVAVSGDHAYLADGFGGLRIIDVSTPTAPTLAGEISVGGFAYGVDVSGDYAYLAADGRGLVIVDVSSPAAPVLVGSVLTTGNARDVAVAGDRAYVAHEDNTCLEVVDVSDPAAPVVTGSGSGLPRPCHSVALAGEVAFAAQTLGFSIFELSDPDAPKEIHSVATSARGIEVFGGLAYVVGTLGVAIYDVSGALVRPARRLGSVAAAASAGSVEVLGGRAYLATKGFGEGAVVVVDVSDPESPTAMGEALPGIDIHGIDVANVAGQLRVYAADPAALWILDATDPANIVPLGQQPLANFGSAVEVVGSLAYVGDGAAGMKIVDVSDPTGPVVLSAFDTPGFVRDIQVVSTRAYLADYDSDSLRIVNVANPSLPLPAGSVNTNHEVNGVKVVQGIAYLANGDGGLRIFRVSDPLSPVPLGQVVLDNASGLQEYAQDLDVVGRTAYVITSYALWIIDVSDPSAPVVVTRVDYVNNGLEQGGKDLVVRNGIAYVARLAGGLGRPDLVLWDVSTPGGLRPALVAHVGGFGPGGGIAVDAAAGLAVAADGTNGVRIVDVADALAANPCRNGLDDDGDGFIDLEDDGCAGPGDLSELPACADGIDNDGDGLVDWPDDPGCRDALPRSKEDPQCQDGIDNDGDGAIDHPADARCQAAWNDDENASPKRCGLGAELAVALGLLWRRWHRKRMATPG